MISTDRIGDDMNNEQWKLCRMDIMTKDPWVGPRGKISLQPVLAEADTDYLVDGLHS